MIQANDLRIGNFYTPTDGSVEKYKSVTADDLKAWDLGAVYGKPIPLTPEILEKCGFVKDTKHGNTLKINEILFLYWGNLEGQLRACFYDVDYSYVPYHIFHLHQLQNLYHALTGQELTFILPML